MKAFVLKEPGVVGWYDAPEPKLTPYGAILEPVAVTPCSSDLHTVFGGGSRKAPNLILGHECVARILETGDMVQDFAPGEVVAVPAITPDWRAKAIQEGNDRLGCGGKAAPAGLVVFVPAQAAFSREAGGKRPDFSHVL